MTPNEIHFLLRSKDLVEKRSKSFRIRVGERLCVDDNSKGDRFQKAKDMCIYEDELYFISQMYEEDWQPRESVIDFDDGTINNVPLREYG
jgi:hypothetical protein